MQTKRTMYANDSLHHRLRPSSGRPWDFHRVGQDNSNSNQQQSSRRARCHNSTILITMTILITGLAAYLITVIAKAPSASGKLAGGFHVNYNSTATQPEVMKAHFEDEEELEVEQQAQKLVRNQAQSSEFIGQRSKAREMPKRSTPTGQLSLEPLSLSSDIISTRVRPASELHTGENLKRLREKLGLLNRADLIKLLGMIQERIEARNMKKRQAISLGHHQQLESRLTHLDQIKPSESVRGGQQVNTSVSMDETEASVEVVTRSRRMEQLINYLDKIEAIMPLLNASALERLSTLEDEQSIVRVVKPDVLGTILHTNGSSPAVIAMPHRQSPSLTPLASIEPKAYPWREPVESVAPDADWQPQQQPQPEVIEDWPAEPVVTSTTQRPRKKKRKRIRTTTTTTTTSTTTTTLAPETTTFVPPTTPAPPYEEVWIEEEEEIVRPPKRKTKKYKKKNSPQPSTTTTSTTTTSTTTTTTPTPITTQPPAVIEDWPEEQWPEEKWPQQQDQVVTTKAPKLWPEQPQPAPEDERQKWPEEEWLNALRDDIQSRLHIVYA